MTRRHRGRPESESPYVIPSIQARCPVHVRPPAERWRHAKFTGLTCEHGTNCRAFACGSVVDCPTEDQWRSANATCEKGGHRAAAGRSGLRSGVCTASRPRRRQHAPHDGGSVWGRRRVLLLNSTYEPLTALPMRRAVIMLLCGKADVVHDDPAGPGDPLGHPDHRGAVGDPAADLRAGALPRPHPDDPGRADAPRPVPLRLLRRQGRHRRPRGAAQPRRRAHLGELRGVLLDLQSPQGRQAAQPSSAGRCGWRRCRRRVSTGGCCRPSRNSTRRGCATWVKVPPDVPVACGLSPNMREQRWDRFTA